MTEEFLQLQKEISSLLYKDNLVSVLVYGSILESKDTTNDLDIIIVVKKVDSSLSDLFSLLSYKFKNLDFNIYSYEVIFGGLSFYSREFKLEYLAKGLYIYGENILKNELQKVNNYQYKRSILIRSIEHLQIVRQKYFSSSLSDNQKFELLRKYFMRISKNILLFNGVGDHTFMNDLEQNAIFNKLIEIKMFDIFPKIDNNTKLDNLFAQFYILSEALIKCKKGFE